MEKDMHLFLDELSEIGKTVDVTNCSAINIEGRKLVLPDPKTDPEAYKLLEKLKQPKSIGEQINRLKHHQVTFTVAEEKLAVKLLGEINYYRISAYRHFLNKDAGKGISFTELMDLYNFDKFLRNEISVLINPIEEMIRTKLAYFLSNYYPYELETCSNVKPGLCYYDLSIYTREKKKICQVNKFIHECFMIVYQQKKKPVKANDKDSLPNIDIIHHIDNYGGFIPIWVLVEHFTLGNLSAMVRLLNRDVLEKWLTTTLFPGNNKITKKMLPEWANTIRELRNCCAHLSRLYGSSRGYSPNLNVFKADISKCYPDGGVETEKLKHTFFGGLLIMKSFYSTLNPERISEWNSFIRRLDKKISADDNIKPYRMGLPRFEPKLFLIEEE